MQESQLCEHEKMTIWWLKGWVSQGQWPLGQYIFSKEKWWQIQKEQAFKCSHFPITSDRIDVSLYGATNYP